MVVPAAAQDVERIRALVLSGSVVKVEAVDPDGRLSLGTAVAVAGGTFVTNCHVTRHAEVVVLVRDGTRWPVDSQLADLYLDLCLLRAAGLAGVPAVPLASAGSLQPRDRVAAAGFSGGIGMQLRFGEVSALHQLGGSRVIQTTTAFTSGASGGALLSATGELAGILTFRLRGAEGYYFASPVDWIADRIDDAAGYVAIAPLAGAAPYWAQPVASLPLFMQAASLEHDGRWGDLLELSTRWVAATPSDAESSFMRASSLAHQGETVRAIEGFRDTLAIDPRYVRAWIDLGQAYVVVGAFGDARRVVDVLRDLDGDAAAELERAVARAAP